MILDINIAGLDCKKLLENIDKEYLLKNLTIITLSELKAFVLGMDKGLNSSMNAIDNENIVMFRINEKPDINSLDLTLYKNNELDRLNNTQSSLFLEDQKETANIKDNRTLIIY